MSSVLIVDDEQNTIKGLIDHVPWNELGVQKVSTAENGLTALEMIQKEQPDILITDVYMPKMSGLELIEIVSKEFPEIYIVIHSGYDEFDNARQAMKFGVQHFFLKPCTVSEIKAVISDILTKIEVEKKQKKLEENYQKQMGNYFKQSRESFLREMLVSSYNTINVSPERLDLYNIPENANIAVASLSLIRFSYFNNKKERTWQLKKFGANNIIKETLESFMNNDLDIYVVDYSDFTFILIFISKKSKQNLQKISYDVSKQIIDNLLLYLNLSLVIGIGNVKNNIYQLVDSYMESQKALEVAEYQEINKVYSFNMLKEDSKEFVYPFELFKEVSHMINVRDYEQIIDKWDELESYLLVKYKPPILVIQNICFNFLSLFTISENIKSEQMSRFFSQIYEIQSPSNVIHWTRNLLEKWIQNLTNEYRKKHSNQLIYEVKRYVQENYDQKIVLAEIAKSLYVNRNYLSQLFKRVTGESFVQYLNKYRIEKAKEILRDSNYMVYEVSEMVGYQNSTYFSQVFKSITGTSPSEYYSKVSNE